MTEFETPESRNEAILQNILGADNELQAPQSRIESYLQMILAMLGGGGDATEVEVAYKILNKQNISIVHSSQSRANYNSYLILTQVGIVYVKVVDGTVTAENLAGYTYTVSGSVSGQTVSIDLGYAWNVGVIIPILNDYVSSVTFS
jgi:hypothetical protein